GWTRLPIALGASAALMIGLMQPARTDPLGRRLYEERCATCHERAFDRAPSRDMLSRNPSAFILNALEGVMEPMARGLSQDDRKAISLYLGATTSEVDGPDLHAIRGPASAEKPLDGPR